MGTALGPMAGLLAIGVARNALGTKSDVRRVADLAHAQGALVDMAALGADFLVSEVR
jgi:selenocysteine lyase/cysteine desulfurase